MRFPFILMLLGLAGCSVFSAPPSGNTDDASTQNEVGTEDVGTADQKSDDEPDSSNILPDATSDVSADTSLAEDLVDVTPDVDDSIAAPDWTQQFLAIYNYESVDLGEDSTTNLLNLQTLGAPTSTTMGHEGSGADIKPGDAFSLNDPRFNDFSIGLTFGGWIKVRSLPTEELDLIATYEASGMGISVSMSSGGTIDCWVGDGVDWLGASTSASWGFDAWTHVVCSYDGANSTVTGYVDALMFDTKTITVVPSSDDRLTIGSAIQEYQLDGIVDESFVYVGILSLDQIARIKACGISGSRCRCDPDDQTLYVSCGTTDCATLPACDAQL